MFKLLILSAGSLVGQNVLEILAPHRERLQLIGCNSLAHEALLFCYDKVYLLPETKALKFKERFLEILRLEQPDMVLAGRDEDVVFLAALAEEHPELAPHILGKGQTAAKIMHDKWLSYQFSQQFHLPFIPSTIASEPDELAAFAAQYGFPLLAKPRAGFASQGVYLPNDLQELKQIAQVEGYMVQQYWGNTRRFREVGQRQEQFGRPLFHSFEEDKYSIQTLIDEAGKIAPLFLSRHIMKYGLSFQVERLHDLELEQIGRQTCQAFQERGWRGPLNIQCQKNEQGRLAILEFNGRFTGASAARAALGYTDLHLAIQNFAPSFSFVDLSEKPFEAQVVSKKLTCFSAPQDWIQRLTSEGVWSASEGI